MSQTRQTILVLGAYGFFGTRICTALARNPRIKLLVAGRDLAKATALAYQLGIGAESARRIDAHDPQLALQLRKLGVNTLIHTAGPFQGQDYSIARSAIKAGCNYLDLADGREFVTRITSLDAEARAAGVCVVSGVSSLPALTAAVVDEYREAFSRLDSIEIGISSGAVIPGIATVRAVLSYCGKPIRVWENGAWTATHGWLDTRSHEFPKLIGTRLLGRCDVPDLELMPQRYPGVKTVSFHAGFGSDLGHRIVELLAKLVHGGKLKSALPFAGVLNTVGRWIRPLVSDRGAMFVTLGGLDKEGDRHELTWNLVARDNHGPHIPCAAAIALAEKIAAGQPPPAGAMPCMGLLTVDDMIDTLKGLSIREITP